MSSSLARQIGVASWCLLAFAVVGRGEEPKRVTACQVKKDPAAYNHKLLELTGLISHGFEDFTLFDPSCSSSPHVWLEYGGTASSGTMYCCGVTADRSRPKPAVVEGIPIPLIDDERFRTFDRLVQQRPDTVVRATIVGRFFAGQQEHLPTGTVWGGYGHMGCCSLFAIQRVLSVDPQSRADLDYRASPDQPNIEKTGCGYRDMVPVESSPGSVAAQQQAERGQSEWPFTDPLRVASDALARFLNIDSTTITGLTQVRKSQGRVLYEWKPRGKQKTYLIVASRPYWLTIYAKDPQRVAWVVIAAYESSCD
jgi:hypothetical protein